MEANDFIAKIKADDALKYKCDLRKVLEESKLVLSKLPAKDRGLFGLNVLRTLCWNLDKAPAWRDNIDNAALLTLAIGSIRETRQMDREDRVKTLACSYHIHKHAVRLTESVPPELVLKISIMPFELDSKYLLKEYHKTYWNILADRLMYIEKLKSKVNIAKLLPKLTADIIKVVEIYNTVQLCLTVLVFLFKKLHLLYSENNAKKLVQPFKQIFSVLCRKDDVEELKHLPEREILDVYTKLNDCLYIIADNSSKIHFDDGILGEIAEKCASLMEHRSDLFYCLWTFYVTSFCKIISHNTDVSYAEGIFTSLQATFQDVNKLGYENALLATYPYLNQLLRLYIEYKVTNLETFSGKIQESCLRLILFFSKNLKDCNQILKCENCPKKTGLHDAFRLSLLIKHLTQDGQEATLDVFYLITSEQYTILAELERLGCPNYQKFFRKLQTDVHNTAISLNKSQLYEISIKLFDIYLNNELKCPALDHKNISRALFNKSICELDSKLYENALITAFLSLMFAQQDGLKTDKYMSLVMDIKAKELKARCKDDDEVELEALQLLTVLDAAKIALENKLYGDLMPFLSTLTFSDYLRHEFSMYCKLWPSVAPVGGVWRALHGLARGDYGALMAAEDEVTVLQVVYDVVLATPCMVRTIHSPYFSTIVSELLDDFDNMSSVIAEERLVHTSLLFLQCEYDLAAASQKYQWKLNEPSTNPDNIPSSRTLPQEHAATRRATLAVRYLRGLVPALPTVSLPRLSSVLQIFQIFVPLLQHLCRDVEALQLAHYCCLIAELVGDRESYLRNAGVLLTSSPPASPAVEGILDRAAEGARGGRGEAELVFLCDVAIYYKSQGKPAPAATLVRAARARISHLADTQPDLNLELAVGRLLEAQNVLHAGSGGPSALTAVNGALRHYLGLSVTGSKWSPRRLRSLYVRVRTSACSLAACALARSLGLRSRARAAAAPALPAEPAPRRAALHALIIDITTLQPAQIKIDQHLKDVLCLDESHETRLSHTSHTLKQLLFTPRQELETMRDNMTLRNDHSPFDIISTVPAFKIAEFFQHHEKCKCFACEVPVCVLLCCKVSSIEAAMYAFANENNIARNYYQGALDMIKGAENKLKIIEKNYMEMFDDFIVKTVLNSYGLELKTIQVKVLIDGAFFALKNKEYDLADEHIIEINEIVQVMNEVDKYLMNDIMNLMAASAQLKKSTKKCDLQLEELENLHTSPVKGNVVPPSTPESKPALPPKPASKTVVKAEELPQKRTLIKLSKLHLEDDDDFEKPKSLTRRTKNDKFRVPNPIIPTPALEEATPRPLRSKPKILLTAPSVDVATPTSKPNKENEFFTPIESTPEQFFTPMTSAKTYAKRTLRQNIVKNLEYEFLTPGPSGVKENRKCEISEINKKLTEKKERSLIKERPKTNEEKSAIKVTKAVIKQENSTLKKESSSKVKVVNYKEDTSKKSTGKDELNLQVSTRTERSKSRIEEKRSLMRSVSPGKMDKEREKTTRRKHR